MVAGMTSSSSTTAHGTVTVPDACCSRSPCGPPRACDGVRVRRRRAVDVERAASCGSRWPRRRGEPLVELAERAQEAVAAALKNDVRARRHGRRRRGGARVISRRQARRQALFLLYQWDLSEGEIGSQYGGEIDPWARELAEETVAQAAELDARITAAVRRLDGRPARRRRAQRAARRDPRARPRRGAAGGRDRRGGRLREALRVRRGGEARQRHPRPDPARGGADERGRVARPRGGAARRGSRLRARELEATDDPEQAIEVLQELSDLAKQIEAELQRARRGRGGGCRGRLTSCASSSRPTSPSWS